MSRYAITVNGCDDQRYVEIDLTPEEADVARKIAEAIGANPNWECTPGMEISEVRP